MDMAELGVTLKKRTGFIRELYSPYHNILIKNRFEEDISKNGFTT